MDLGLDGKVALVTGGSEGIGKVAARRLAQEGVRVVICARRADVLERAASEITQDGGQVLAVPADVTDPDQINHLFDVAIAAYGGIDILVNNAGKHMSGYFTDMTDEEWRDDLNLKLFAAVRCSRLAIPHMRARGGGRIINITTPAGKAPPARSVPTSVSRAAGIAMTKALSLDYARDNILVNTVCIGHIKSAQQEWWADHYGYSSMDDWYADKSKEIPLGRVGETDEAADLIVFLASARASYITGTAINMDGGLSAVV